MDEVARGGRTVLFVSHNMHAIRRLCTEVIVLSAGKVTYHGAPDHGVRAYEEQVLTSRQGEQFHERREGSGEYRFTEVRPDKLLYEPAEPKVISFRIARRGRGCGHFFLAGFLFNSGGASVLQMDSRLVGPMIADADEVSGRLTIKTPWLKPGDYRLDLCICSSGFVDKWEGACYFRVSEVLPYPFAAHEEALYHGVVLGDFQWETSSR
jgi:lipopolysaccharide transport system ATP-binding protein